MTEQKGRHRKRDEKLQHKDDRCLLDWDGWGIPREFAVG